MLEAALWGFVGGSSLLVGAVLAVYVPWVQRHVGLIMGFGAGVLISAVAYELVAEALHVADGAGVVAGGFAAGSIAYFGGDLLVARGGGSGGASGGGASEGGASEGGASGGGASEAGPSGGGGSGGGAARSIVLGTVLDGVPESVVIGVSLIGGGGASVAVIAAVFLSNIPESVAATKGLIDGGMSRARAYLLWSAITALTTISSALGYVLLDGAPESTIAFVQAFAGGAVLTMLASAMMPEAFEKGGRLTGLATSLGFAVALAITAVG
jgi:zinc transporter, ZIP family